MLTLTTSLLKNTKSLGDTDATLHATSRNIVARNMLRLFDHSVATCGDMLHVVAWMLSQVLFGSNFLRNFVQHFHCCREYFIVLRLFDRHSQHCLVGASANDVKYLIEIWISVK